MTYLDFRLGPSFPSFSSPPLSSVPPNTARGMGEHCKLPYGVCHSRRTIWLISEPKTAALLATIFVNFLNSKITRKEHDTIKLMASHAVWYNKFRAGKRISIDRRDAVRRLLRWHLGAKFFWRGGGYRRMVPQNMPGNLSNTDNLMLTAVLLLVIQLLKQCNNNLWMTGLHQLNFLSN